MLEDIITTVLSMDNKIEIYKLLFVGGLHHQLWLFVAQVFHHYLDQIQTALEPSQSARTQASSLE